MKQIFIFLPFIFLMLGCSHTYKNIERNDLLKENKTNNTKENKNFKFF